MGLHSIFPRIITTSDMLFPPKRSLTPQQSGSSKHAQACTRHDFLQGYDTLTASGPTVRDTFEVFSVIVPSGPASIETFPLASR
jgi:hypothetical protein